jgi:hypothetical protein
MRSSVAPPIAIAAFGHPDRESGGSPAAEE